MGKIANFHECFLFLTLRRPPASFKIVIILKTNRANWRIEDSGKKGDSERGKNRKTTRHIDTTIKCASVVVHTSFQL